MNKRTLLLGTLGIGAALAATIGLGARSAAKKAAPGAGTHAAVEAYVKAQMRRLHIPGLSLAIVQGDEIALTRGYGRACPGGQPPTPQTPFVLGSTTKSFTALAVMQLVEAGEVELDAPVQRYLPWFQVADPDASRQITVRHLLNQTGGLPQAPGMANLADLDDAPGAVERQVRALSTVKLAHPVGAAFEYSNLNYNILGLIVEAASGESYVDYVQRHVLAPLDMKHSHTSQEAARQDGLAVGHRYWFTYPVAIRDLPLPAGSIPSGQLISTSEDMAHYLIAHLNGGRYGDAHVLSSAGIDELQRGVGEQKVMGRVVSKYGMGWFVSEIGGTRLVSHTGNVPDFSSFMALLPEQKKGIVLLANADHGLPFILMEVGEGAAALLAGQEPAPIRFGFFPWVMRALPLIPLLQVVDIVATVRLLRRWRADPSLCAGRGGVWGRHVLLPLIPSLSLPAVLGLLQSGGLLGFVHLFLPDLAWIVRTGGGFAAIWAIVRTGLILETARKSLSP